MKTTALACYLESIACALRASKSPTLPLIKWTSFRGPRVLHVGSAAIPLPDHAGESSLATIFPDAIPTGSAAQAVVVTDRNELADLRAQVEAVNTRNLQLMDVLGQRKQVETNLRQSLEETKTEANALRQTIDRMRGQGGDIRPAPRQPVPVAQVAGDLLSAIVADQDAGRALARAPGAQADDSRQPAPVVLAFPINGQGKTLAAAGILLDDLRVRFAFRFIDPKDATRGGYWLAKDATAPGTHLMVQRLKEAGATIGNQLPASLLHA